MLRDSGSTWHDFNAKWCRRSSSVAKVGVQPGGPWSRASVVDCLLACRDEAITSSDTGSPGRGECGMEGFHWVITGAPLASCLPHEAVTSQTLQG